MSENKPAEHTCWDGAVVLRINSWEGDRFVVDADVVESYITSGQFMVRPFKYIQIEEIRAHYGLAVSIGAEALEDALDALEAEVARLRDALEEAGCQTPDMVTPCAFLPKDEWCCVCAALSEADDE